VIPPADRFYDPGKGDKKDLTDTGDDFLAIGPALRIMQLNVEGLSADKREVISSIAERQKIDVICSEETHVDVDKTNRFSIAGFDLLAYSLHAKYVRDNISDAHHVGSSVCYDVIRIGSYHVAKIYKPPSENWGTTNTLPVLPHPSLLVGDFNSHHPDWRYQEPEEDCEMLQDWASGNDYHLIYDSNQRGTFHSARWKRDYSPDLCWVSSVNGRPQPASCTVLEDFPQSASTICDPCWSPLTSHERHQQTSTEFQESRLP